MSREEAHSEMQKINAETRKKLLARAKNRLFGAHLRINALIQLIGEENLLKGSFSPGGKASQ